MTALADACADIGPLLARAAALITVPDADGTQGGSRPGSAPPWNPSAAAAALDAHEGLRRLEASLRMAVTGRTGPRRGGSDANTMEAITAIENLGQAVTTTAAATAARILCRWSLAIMQLPAVDEAERPQRITAMCPYCQVPMLRVFPRQGEITCLRKGACFDANGDHPRGAMEIGRFGPQVRWADGLVT